MHNSLAGHPHRPEQVKDCIADHRDWPGSGYNKREAADWLHWDSLMYGDLP